MNITVTDQFLNFYNMKWSPGHILFYVGGSVGDVSHKPLDSGAN